MQTALYFQYEYTILSHCSVLVREATNTDVFYNVEEGAGGLTYVFKLICPFFTF